MKAFILALCCVLTTLNGLAQTLSGKVFGKSPSGERQVLPGAVVRWLSYGTGTATNENGVFQLSAEGVADHRLVVSQDGHYSDTMETHGKSYITVVLHEQPQGKALTGVTVRGNQSAYRSNLSSVKTEIITQGELSKAACCDLAGCFGTQAAVQPQTTNVITNAQELRILGLSGVYNQLLVDGLPMITGAAYTYGISTYPGSIVDNIYVAKGATSVLQGFEGISGQINLVTLQPDKAPPLYLNAYINSFGEKHLNANLAMPIGKAKKWHSLLALHAVQPAGRVDNNNDGFLDLPLLTRYMAFNKWRYGSESKKGMSAEIGLRLVHEKRIGGQSNYAYGSDAGSNTIYGQSVVFTQPEAYLKSVYRFNTKQAVSLSVSGLGHEQNAWFGVTHYTVSQRTANLVLQHDWDWRTHELKWGLSYRYQNLKETIGFTDNSLGRSYAGTYQTPFRLPGVFAENAFHWHEDKLLLLVGARLDHHQDWGAYFTPRSMLRWTIDKHNTFRASVGRGWRQVNLFSEQVNMLVSARDILFAERLRPEEALTWGLSHSYRFTKGVTTGTLSADFYSTHFSNQFFPDYDRDARLIVVENFDGVSRSNGLQVEASFIFFQRLEARAAYNYLDVYRMEQGQKVVLPFNPSHRAMSALSYHTANRRWQADANVHWMGQMRLPDTRSNPEAYRRPLWSEAFATLNMQGTFRWKSLELYGGCENVFGYTQANPIISADNPFGPYFDISSVWGPTRGREFYLGLRWRLARAEPPEQ